MTFFEQMIIGFSLVAVVFAVLILLKLNKEEKDKDSAHHV